MAPQLGAARSFAVLAPKVVSSGTSIITGDAGVSPSGNPAILLGRAYSSREAAGALSDSAAAYADLAGRACTPAPLGNTLAPGIYCVASSWQLQQTLTLDAGGNKDAVWIIKVAGALTIPPNVAVRVINGGYDGNVYWQIAGSASLGAGSAVAGTILALNDISLAHGATLSGRALAQHLVTLDESNVSICCQPVAVSPSSLPIAKVGQSYSQNFAASGGLGTYTFAFAQPLPPGLTASGNLLSGAPTTAGTYPLQVTAVDQHGCPGVQLYELTVSGLPALPPLPPLPPVVCVPTNIVITVSGGAPPYMFTTTTPLPAGFSLSPAGVLSVTSPGCATFTVTVTDTMGASASRAYTVCGMEVLPAALPGGTVGAPYSQNITATGGTPPYTCTTTGSLPAGLASSGCTIAGVPTTVGCSTFTVTVTDANGVACSRTYTICIKGCSLAILPPPPPNGVAGSLYNYQFATSGGAPPTTFALISGTLPPPLVLPASGLLFGTPATAGGYSFTVRATDSAGCSVDASYNVAITCPTITISPATLPAGNVGTNYAQMITASGGTAPYVFTRVSGALPPALTLAPNGALSGPPTTPGVYCFTVLATDANGCTGGPIAYTITINAATCPGGTTITLSPNPLPPAYTGLPYAQVITAAGGTPPYTFAVTSGTLPPLLGLNPVTGLLSGTPTTPGLYIFTITATDANGCVGSLGCEIPMTVDIPATSPWELLTLCIVLAVTGLLAMRRDA